MKPIALTLFFFCSLFSFGQNKITDLNHSHKTKLQHSIDEHESHKCADDVAEDLFWFRHPNLSQKEVEMNERILSKQSQRSASHVADRYISVVVHVIHLEGPENISDAQIHQGIADLNDAFANAGEYESPDGVDSHIRFCLAQQDEHGMPSNGITRAYSDLTFMNMETDDLALKNLDHWDPTLYLNIWLVSSITSASMGNSVAGYAYLPYSHGMPEDGIVNEANWFGSSSDHSKVHIHEVGHYLGLYHTFQGGCTNNDCTTEGDRVCDTPPDASTAYAPCGTPMNTCASDSDDSSDNNPFRSTALGGLGDQNDLVENYMDYSNQQCQTLFSAGQSERMNATLDEVRYSLLGSNGCLSSCGISEIQLNPNSTELIIGDLLHVVPTFVFNGIVNFSWTIHNDVIATSHVLNHTVTAEDLGAHYLVYTVTNPSLGCSRADSILVVVHCDVPADFSFSPQYIDVNDVVTFSASSTTGFTYEWFLDGQAVSTNESFERQFTEPLGHHIYLVTGNGECTDTTSVDYFAVGDCVSGSGNHWVLGQNAGIHVDFSSGVPVSNALAMNETATNLLYSAEGLATISDQNGELLLYSDGEKIFNRNFEVFYTGLGAGGSSSQGVQIVPNPGNPNEYYIFTVEHFGGYLEIANTGAGFSYIKVDMTLNNGLGGVSSDYIRLLEHVTETQTAIRHCNGHDIWVICHSANNNAFYNYLLTDQGISEPIITNIGYSYSADAPLGNIGGLKANPQGTILVQGSAYYGLQFFHFDASSGQLIDDMGILNGNFYYGAYGIEFSPDGSKMYYTGDYDIYIYQLDFSSGNLQTIFNSKMIIGTSNRPYYMGQFQLAPDGKIYIARTNDESMDVIEHPDEAGLACSFVNSGLTFSGQVLFGINNILLPKNISAKPQIIGPTVVCSGGENIEYTVSCGNNTWEVQGSATVVELSSTTISLSFPNSGTNLLTCSRYDDCMGWLIDTLEIHVNNFQLDLGNDTTICSTGVLELHAPSEFITYQWNTGAATSSIIADQAGTYSLIATGIGGCSASDQIVISNFEEDFDVPSQTFELCMSQEGYFDLVPIRSDLELHWWTRDGSTVHPFHMYVYANQPDFPLLLFYTSEHGCVDADTIWVTHRPDLPIFNLGEPLTICQGAVETIHVDESQVTHCSYTWPDGSHGTDYSVYSTGNDTIAYVSAMRYDSLCNAISYATLTVNILVVPNLQLTDSLGLCPGAQILLNSGSTYPNVTWQDGTIAETYVASSFGTYSISVDTPCGTYRDTTVVHAIIPSDYILDLPDTIRRCSNRVPFLLQTGNDNFETYTWTNATNGIVFGEGLVSLTATYQCMSSTDSVFVDVLEQAYTIFPSDVSYCNNDSVYLIQLENQTTTWYDGSVSDSLLVTQSGVYTYTTVRENGCRLDGSVNVHMANYNFNIQDTVICEGTVLTIYPQYNGSYMFWDGQYNPNVIEIADSGAYEFILFTYNCFNYFRFRVDFGNPEYYDLGLSDDISACENDFPITITSSGDEALSYSWSTGSSERETVADEAGWYTLTAQYSCGQKSDSVLVHALPIPIPGLPSDSVLCSNSNLILEGIEGNQNNWSTGISANQISIASAGIYSLESIDQNGCIGRDSIQVTETTLFVDVSGQTIFCPGDSVEISGFSNGTLETWNTGWTENTNYTSTPGYYELQASLGNCIESEGITVQAYPNYPLDLGNDTIVNGSSLVLHAIGNYFNYQWSVAGQNGSSISVSSSGSYALSVTDENGCSYSDTIMVSLISGINDLSANSFLFIPQNFNASYGLNAIVKNVNIQSVSIFDDLGRLISSSGNSSLLWNGAVNGSTASTGMYFYVIHYTDSMQNHLVRKGKVLLVE